MSVLGLIPARGGSKGLPGKNLRTLGGRPLIGWTIETALESGALQAVVVTTDDPGIARVAEADGAEVLIRPPELADDTSPMMAVVNHAIDFLSADGRSFTHVMLLQPTSPLRVADDIREALRLMRERDARAIVSVSLMEHSPLIANTLPPDGSMAEFVSRQVAVSNRQEMPDYYRVNGAVYVADVGFLRENGSFIGEGAFAYVMPAERSVDVDSELDLTVAAAIIAGRTE